MLKAFMIKSKMFFCPYCEYKCSRKSNMTVHVNRVHNKIKPYHCQLCEYKCSSNHDLTIHTKIRHTKVIDHECSHCDYRCSTKGDIMKHIDKCTGESNISSGENAVIKALKDLGFEEKVDYYHDVNDPYLEAYTGRRLRFDFQFVDHDIVIEYDGKHHYYPVYFGRTKNQSERQKKASEKLADLQARDKLKDEYCKENGIKMIRITYTDFTNILGILSDKLFDIVDQIEY